MGRFTVEKTGKDGDVVSSSRFSVEKSDNSTASNKKKTLTTKQKAQKTAEFFSSLPAAQTAIAAYTAPKTETQTVAHGAGRSTSSTQQPSIGTGAFKAELADRRASGNYTMPGSTESRVLELEAQENALLPVLQSQFQPLDYTGFNGQNKRTFESALLANELQRLQNERINLQKDSASSTPAASFSEPDSRDHASPKRGFLNETAYHLERGAAGILSAVEGVADAFGVPLATALEWVFSVGGTGPNANSELFGAWADDLLYGSPTEEYLENIRQYYQPTQQMEELGNIPETVGSMLPAIGAAILTGGSSTAINAASNAQKGSTIGQALFGLQAAGGGMAEAAAEGADRTQAIIYGTESGLLETIVENISGGLPFLNKGVLSQAVQKVLSNPAVNKILDVAGEGGEEAVSAIITPYLKRAVYDPDAENATADEIAENAIMGMIGAGILQVGIELPSYLSQKDSVVPDTGIQETITEEPDTLPDGFELTYGADSPLVQRTNELLQNPDSADAFDGLPDDFAYTYGPDSPIVQRANQLNSDRGRYAAPDEFDGLPDDFELTYGPDSSLVQEANLLNLDRNEPGFSDAPFSDWTSLPTEDLLRRADEVLARSNTASQTPVAAPVSEALEQQTAEELSLANPDVVTPPVAETQPVMMPVAEQTVIPTTKNAKQQGVQIPIDERTWQDAGNRKVNAFQYDNPELHPYFVEAAKALQYDLSHVVKGERMPVQDASSATGKEIIGFTGTKRSVTEPIAQALDNANLSYSQIEKALSDLIANNGQENYAAAKKVELVLDDMLTNGYTDSDGYDVPPNEEYIAAREAAIRGADQASTDYRMSEEEWNSIFAQEPSEAPVIMPVADKVDVESSVGAARKGFDPYSAFLGTKSEFFPEGANAARPVDVPTTDAQGNPIRKTASTAMGAKAIPDEVVGDIQNMVMSGDLSYKRVTDRDSINRAISRIKADGFQRALGDFSDAVQKGVVSKDMATLGQQLLVNAANAGDSNSTAEILSLYAQMETVAGQAVQAASILRKLSPTAQLYAAQKVASNLEKTLSKQLKGENITINPDLIAEFNEQTTQEGRDAVMEKIYKDLAAQVPSTWRDKWNAWRYLSMLGNSRTHVKNIGGNVGFQPIRFVKDRIAALIESGVSKASGGKLKRTKSFAYNPKLYAAAWQDFDNVSDVLSGSKYDDVQSIIQDKRTIFKFKPLEALRRVNSNLLSAEDMVFKRITYADALAGYLNANGVTAEQFNSGNVDNNLLSSARDYAGQEALKATYNDRNQFSDAVVNAAKGLGTFGEAVLPFKRTPANVLARGVEYSPIGLAKGLTYDLYQVKQGNLTGAEAIDNISAGLTGSALMALGGLLAASGIVTGGADDDDKQQTINDLTGGQTYALNLPGGGSVTLDWLAPEALPFFMGVQAMESFGEEGLTGDSITSAFASISEPMLEMSMLQSLNDLLDNISYASSNEKFEGLIGSALISYLTQAIPTIGGQIERTFEDKRYSTYINKDSIIPTDIQYALGKASAKIPGWDFQQIPYIDAWGREEPTGLMPIRALNNFLNPAYTSYTNVTPVDAEIQRLYNQIGDGGVVPSRADKSFTVNQETINLSGNQYVEYATQKGQTAYNLLEQIIQTEAYQNMSDSEKADTIKDIYKYADAVGKSAVSSYKPDGWIGNVINSGIPADDYVVYRATADQDGNGAITQSESAVALLPIFGLTDQQKGEIWQGQSSSWNEEKNPFTGALANAGIDPELATEIMQKYSEIDNASYEGESVPRQKQTALSQYLDGLDLTPEQRSVVDDTYKFYTMFTADVIPYSLETMSDAAQKKWPEIQNWGMNEEEYLKYYPIVSQSGKKKDEIIRDLMNAGMSWTDANSFWKIIKSTK